MRKAQKMKMTQKMEKKNKVNPKIEDSRKVNTYLYHTTFKVETRNRNPHVKKHDFR